MTHPISEEKMQTTEFNVSNPVPEQDEDWVPYDIIWEFHELLYLIQGHFKDENQYLKDILNKVVKYFFYPLKPAEELQVAN